ncbi:MAG: hypothetical protein J0H99_01700 [Rhodospirillales bacterium]|nr:hypothetical protein [Rhodospirillales bacterium]MBN8905346.1 hypothetical protein [Rhodospirillales bacterium]
MSGIWGAVALASDDSTSVVETRLHCNDFLARRAAELDREADLQLAHGRHLAAENLAWKAEELRAGGVA